ncbi:MAG: hypothetical protein M1829_003901 [Trizodia sp. TS-e1964]|nr:MAG: hypothetical protein M1829_003901 [Trizodia sp. TS-e1964]
MLFSSKILLFASGVFSLVADGSPATLRARLNDPQSSRLALQKEMVERSDIPLRPTDGAMHLGSNIVNQILQDLEAAKAYTVERENQCSILYFFDANFDEGSNPVRSFLLVPTTGQQSQDSLMNLNVEAYWPVRSSTPSRGYAFATKAFKKIGRGTGETTLRILIQRARPSNLQRKAVLLSHDAFSIPMGIALGSFELRWLQSPSDETWFKEIWKRMRADNKGWIPFEDSKS